MDADTRRWLTLNRLPDLRSAQRRALADGRLTAADVLAASMGAGRRPRHAEDAPSTPALEADLSWLAAPGRSLLTLAMDAYPPRLRHIADPPPVLFVDGDAAALERPQLAIVGSRRATPSGVETAFSLGAELARCGVAIVSGLALGVDGAAHRGALAAAGITVAVAANGLDRVYPRSHQRLAACITERGALVSEFPPGTAPLPRNFPRRNRIISGLSLGVVVVEAELRSGSLISARLAGEQGREVFAVPGPIQSPQSRGCHLLIRQGAKLVESLGDILEELPGGTWIAPDALPPAPPGAGAEGLDSRQQRVLECFGHRVSSVDSLVERSGLTADTVSSILLALELRGLVVPVLGGAFCRVTTGLQRDVIKKRT